VHTAFSEDDLQDLDDDTIVAINEFSRLHEVLGAVLERALDQEDTLEALWLVLNDEGALFAVESAAKELRRLLRLWKSARA
jgi:hypothetical protein